MKENKKAVFDRIWRARTDSFHFPQVQSKMTSELDTSLSSSSLPEETEKAGTVRFGDELATTLIDALSAAGIEHILWGQMPLWLFGVPTIVNVSSRLR